eukprot:6664452-Prymnesium_polylepis.1
MQRGTAQDAGTHKRADGTYTYHESHPCCHCSLERMRLGAGEIAPSHRQSRIVMTGRRMTVALSWKTLVKARMKICAVFCPWER